MKRIRRDRNRYELLNALVMLGYLPINEGKEPRPDQPMLLQHTNIDVQIPSEFVTPRLLADAEQADFDVSVLQKRRESEKETEGKD